MLADSVFLADIYPARERPVPGVSAQLIADQMALDGHPVTAGPLSLEQLLPRLKAELRPGDLFITMGAGDVLKLGEQLAADGKKKSKTTATQSKVAVKKTGKAKKTK
jgi:UDP-N-acetylmuramate--alanine ligase